MKFRYAAVIPCYDVGPVCIPVLRKTTSEVQICVAVDDGSTDDTLASIQSLASASLVALRHDHNQGKGSALITGFRHILKNHLDIDAIIALDGDGQHDPALIQEFLDEYEKNEPDLIYGNRFSRIQGMPWHREVLNNVSNKIISRICRQSIFDSQCGFRLYSRKLIQDQISDWSTSRYELETEILIKACRQGRKVTSVPVSMIYSAQSTKLSHHSLKDVLRIGKVLARNFWDR